MFGNLVAAPRIVNDVSCFIVLSLFVAGAMFGDLGLSLLVAGAVFGDLGLSLFVAGAIVGDMG